MDEKIALQLNKSATVITANRRLANYWQKQFSHWQSSQGHCAWVKPDIIPLEEWLLRSWQATLPSQKLINQVQSLTLWEMIICQSEAGEQLLQSQATAVLAKDAWDIMRAWKIPLAALSREASLDIQTFLQWAQEYDRQCQQRHYLDQHGLIDDLIDSSSLKNICLSKQHWLAGFINPVSPQVQTLFNKLLDVTSKDYLPRQPIKAQVQRVECLDTTAELKAMARWAHLCLQQSPTAKIACVVPELSNQRETLLRIFREEFITHSSKYSFNISLGKSLSCYPVIQTALLILELDQPRIETQILSRVLLSPFLGGAELELGARALLDQRLRDENQLEVHLRKILVLAREAKNQIDQSPTLILQIEKFLQTIKVIPYQQSPSQWAKLFIQQLTAMGWPGDRTLSSEEFQTVKRLQQLLTEFSELEIIMPRMTIQEAKRKIVNMAKQIIFQPESPETPIQILGVLEAVGMQFDHLWLMGLHDQQWPSPPSPNPFIPIRLQRSLGIPQSSPQHIVEYYKKLTDIFANSANDVIFSYPALTEDRPLRASPLINQYPVVSLQELNINSVKTAAIAPHQFEWIEDLHAPALNGQEHKGGSKILELQAQCPFKAFAQLRLDVATIKAPTLGLTPIERGSLLHDALARIWQQLKSSERLNALTTEELKTLVATQVKSVLQDFTHKKPLVFLPRFTQNEQARLEKLILGWLEFEKKRSPFNVSAIEKSVTMQIAGMDIQLRIDRIDKNHDGARIVLDYKTSKLAGHDWLEPQPLQLQLPLYACVESDAIMALAFAQIRPEQYKFIGISESREVLPGTDELNNKQNNRKIIDLIVQWQQWFSELSKAYQAGVAAVAPKNKSVCDHCELKSLCRIDEEQQHVNAD